MRVVLRGLLFVALVLAGCANGGDEGDGAAGDLDGGGQDGRDGGAGDGGGTVTCGAGQHMCGGGCIDDLENVPENGCRLGCGEPCPTPPDGVASCDESGMCTTGCEPPFHLEGTECVCTPNTCEDIGYMCGAPDDGCGTPLDCGACEGDGTCMDGICSCTEDEQEPNDSTLAVAMIGGTLTDSPDSTASFTAFTLHAEDDEDWFRMAIDDAGAGGNPVITVVLDDIPAGSDYELSAWYVCSGGTDASNCTVGDPCTGAASGVTSETIEIETECEHISTEEDGALWIRVTAARWGGSCAPYSLEVTVE